MKKLIVALFYSFSDLNLLDWSANNLLAVCLGGSLYLWNASTGAIQQLFQMEGPEQYIGSVSWMKASNCIAVGTSNGDVQVGLCSVLLHPCAHHLLSFPAF